MIPVFVDSDVIISSLISSTGAAHFLLNQADNLSLFISTLSQKELEIVTERLQLDRETLHRLLNKRFSKVELVNAEDIRKKYIKYVLDTNDAHIVAGAEKAGTRFLITYNTKHFKIDKIKKDLGIIVVTPATFLQYLRSLQ